MVQSLYMYTMNPFGSGYSRPLTLVVSLYIFWSESATTTHLHFNPVSESYMEQEFTCSPTLKHVLNVCFVHHYLEFRS